MRDASRGALRVAFFPDAYNEVDGVANTARHFEAFAQDRGLPFLTIHAGPQRQTVVAGSVTRVQLPRGPITFPLDRTHHFDLAFMRYAGEVAHQVQDFDPDIVHITGPSDLGMLGAWISYRLQIPLAASWQTNLHQYARTRLAAKLDFLPMSWTAKLLDAAEHWSWRGATRFYKVPRLLFAPNPEMVRELSQATGKPCFPMSHSVDTNAFNPAFRCRQRGPFRIGYVGRLTAEKNVRLLARLEQALLARGRDNFQMVVIGQGGEETWLRQHMTTAEFTGVLTGRVLAEAFADMDLFVFPSETDTFGLVVLEAMASGVPAVVTAAGGPKFTVNHGQTGFVARDFNEFVECTDLLLTRPELLAPMRLAARQHALSTSWERIFEGMYSVYQDCLRTPCVADHSVLDVAKV